MESITPQNYKGRTHLNADGKSKLLAELEAWNERDAREQAAAAAPVEAKLRLNSYLTREMYGNSNVIIETTKKIPVKFSNKNFIDELDLIADEGVIVNETIQEHQSQIESIE